MLVRDTVRQRDAGEGRASRSEGESEYSSQVVGGLLEWGLRRLLEWR